MTEPHVFTLADNYLNSIVQQIADDQWSLLIPDSIKMGSHIDRTGMTLRTLINYHAYDDIWVPDVLAGRTMAEVGADKWKDEDLLGDDPKTRFAIIVANATAAAGKVTDEQLDQVAHLSFGDFKIREYFWQISQFRAFRAWEFAKLIGVDATMPDELVQGITDELTPNVEQWRAIGVFGPAVVVPEDASAQDKLLALSGRDPR